MRQKVVIEFDPVMFEESAGVMGDGQLAQQLVNIFMFSKDVNARASLAEAFGMEVGDFSPCDPEPASVPRM